MLVYNTKTSRTGVNQLCISTNRNLGMKLCIVFLLLAWFRFALAELGVFNLEVRAEWSYTPFVANLVEAIAANTNEYEAAIRLYASTEDDDTDINRQISDQAVYKKLLGVFQPELKQFIDFDLVYKVHSPRIASHYGQFNKEYGNELKNLQRTCATDSFGVSVPFLGEAPHAFLVFNDKIYCSPQDTYALKTQISFKQETQEFDRVIGKHQDAPLVILYGVPGSQVTLEFLRLLLSEADAGKLKFTWRYLPCTSQKDPMIGFGARLLSKDTVPLTFDGDEFAQQILSESSNFDQLLRMKELFRDVSSSKKLEVVRTEELKQKFLSSKKNNSLLGLSSNSVGLYVNGAIIPKAELSPYSLIATIKKELRRVKMLTSLGFNTKQAKTLLGKFALLSTVKEIQYKKGNSVMGSNDNRFSVYNDENVVFFNNIEQDQNYREYTENAHLAYLKHSKQLRAGQIPPLKANVHDLIFVINLSDRRQLEVFFTLAKVILDRAIPQQVGVLPLVSGAVDEKLATVLSFLFETSTPQEALGFLYKCYLSETDADGLEEIIESVPVPNNYSSPNHNTTTSRLSIDSPSVIVNGVIYEMKSIGWQSSMVKQLTQDVMLLKRHLETNKSLKGTLKDVLYENASNSRNLRVAPQDPSLVLYKKVTSELFEHAITLRMNVDRTHAYGTIWIIGDLSSQKPLEQLEAALKFISQEKAYQLKLLNTVSSSIVQQLIGSVKDSRRLNFSGVKEIQKQVKKLLSLASVSSKGDSWFHHLLEKNGLPLAFPFILFNSRFFRIDQSLSFDELVQLSSYDFKQRASILFDLITSYETIFELKSLMEFAINDDSGDWLDLVLSEITDSFYHSDFTTTSDANRFDFSKLDYTNAITFQKGTNEVEVFAIVDPLNSYSQDLIEIVHTLLDFDFLNITILLHPSETSEAPKAVSSAIIPKTSPQFSSTGQYLLDSEIKLVAEKQDHWFLELHVPFSWFVVQNLSTVELDTQNFNLSSDKWALYQLKHLVIDGYAKDILTGYIQSDTVLQISKEEQFKDTLIMSNLGYFQFQATPGVYSLGTRCQNKEECYGLLSASESFNISRDVVSLVPLLLFSLSGLHVTPRLQKASHGEGSKEMSSNLSFWKKKQVEKDEINVFTIASGELYERLVGIMFLSVVTNTKKLVKFWLVEDFLSAGFKRTLPELASQIGFKYNLVSYKWPVWLRSQLVPLRMAWGYKILFLDVLFPQHLKRVVFIDADQVLRGDAAELMDVDLQGAPYGFTPMCESKKEMEGYMFWKRGYWADHLKNGLKYHISAMFVVDLDQFKVLKVADRLRTHYQKLSSDPKSLLNLDQDLPNNLQHIIPIHSLPQEWLWCDTWCTIDELRNAKAIDLCNDPTSSESKIERAKRVVSEWEKYDTKVQKLYNNVKSSSPAKPQAVVIPDFHFGIAQDDQESDYSHDEL